MPIKPVTVSQLNTYLKQIFDAEELLHNISVVGEISGYSNIRGTAYFTLKDEMANLSCISFYGDSFVDFKNGDSVVVIGSPQYYVKGGKLNFNVIKMEHYGESILYQKFLELKANLEQKGYFDQSHKIPMPSDIKRIGVVSSEGGAVIQDIINIRTRRNPKIDIVLYPVKVQGINAEYEIAKGIELLDNYNVDAIIVARGGGSMEDLQPFNTEVVANATYNCHKFIVSAVGHETDYTIIDFCSDLRAPTPSAAAELLCDNIYDKKVKYYNNTSKLINAYTRYIFQKKQNFYNNIKQFLKEYLYIEQDSKSVYNNYLVSLLKNLNNYFIEKQNLLKYNSDILKKLNPTEVLKLGYASIKLGDKYISSKFEINKGDKIFVCLKDGMINADVTGVE